MRNYFYLLMPLLMGVAASSANAINLRGSEQEDTMSRIINSTKASAKELTEYISYGRPSAQQIQKDIIGKEITEGFDKDECYFPDTQRWTIKEENLRDFKVEQVLADEEDTYTVVAHMTLDAKYTSFDALARITYSLNRDDKWELDYIKSLGVRINRTHKYDDCLTFNIGDDGWGGTYSLYIKNTVGVKLFVGGELIFVDGNRKRFTSSLEPFETSQVGGLFKGGSVYSYEIDFIERPGIL